MSNNINLNRDILLSVKPAYANLLVDGIKTIELRRKFPTAPVAGTRIVIYSSSPEKLVIGDCEIKEILHLPTNKLWSSVATEALVAKDFFDSYFDGLDSGFGIRVWKARRYKKPIPLVSVLGKKAVAPQSYRYLPDAAL